MARRAYRFRSLSSGIIDHDGTIEPRKREAFAKHRILSTMLHSIFVSQKMLHSVTVWMDSKGVHHGRHEDFRALGESG
jgi:hypothetical protein